MREQFFSKILLFGEYSVIKHSKALAIPFPAFGGALQLKEGSLDRELKSFLLYLKNKKKHGQLLSNLNLSLFDEELQRGLSFHSTIPQGHGLGSSGALTAAIYNRYSENQTDDLNLLKDYFAQLESHFHGESSGIDPLVSYLNHPLLLSGLKSIELVDFSMKRKGPGTIFLLDSGVPRRTGALVKLFLEKCKEERFARLTDEVLIPITNRCVESLLQNKSENLFEFFRTLSDFQFRHFSPMIPDILHDLWQSGLQKELFYLKLCGAGGGGHFLGVTFDFEQTQKECENFTLLPIIFF